MDTPASFSSGRFQNWGRPQLSDNPFIVSRRVTGVVVDFLLALPGYEAEIVERAIARPVAGRDLWFSTAEDLVIQKVAANRDKDWTDVAALLAAQRGRLDLDYVQDWIAGLPPPLISRSCCTGLVRCFRRALSARNLRRSRRAARGMCRAGPGGRWTTRLKLCSRPTVSAL